MLIAASVSQVYALHLLQQLGGSGGASAAQAHQLARALSLERLIVQAVQLLPPLPRLVSILKAFASSAKASSNQAFEGPVSLLVPTPACCAPCKQAGRLGDTVFWSANPHVFINCGQHVAMLLWAPLLEPVGRIDSLAFEELVCTWGSAAVSALRLMSWLRLAAQAIEQCQPSARRVAMEAGKDAGRQCFLLAVNIAFQCGKCALELYTEPHAAEQLQRSLPDVLPVLWALHTAGCRLVADVPALAFSPVISFSLHAAS